MTEILSTQNNRRYTDIQSYLCPVLLPDLCGPFKMKVGRQCGFHVTPHQLRHTCATMLLNAGVSIRGVQRILGHKYVETTLRYTRVYDSTVVKDFQRASSRDGKGRAPESA